MERIRLFQRTLLTALTGINSFVFCQSGNSGTVLSIVYAGISMLVMLSLIMTYCRIKKTLTTQRIRNK